MYASNSRKINSFKLTLFICIMLYLELICTKFTSFFKMNKIIVSIILALTLVFVINKITDSIYYVEKPKKSAYQVDIAVSSESSETKEVSSDTVNIMALFASTSAGEGQKIFTTHWKYYR